MGFFGGGRDPEGGERARSGGRRGDFGRRGAADVDWNRLAGRQTGLQLRPNPSCLALRTDLWRPWPRPG